MYLEDALGASDFRRQLELQLVRVGRKRLERSLGGTSLRSADKLERKSMQREVDFNSIE